MQKLVKGFLVFTVSSVVGVAAAAAATTSAPSARTAFMGIDRIALDDPTIIAIFDEANTADIETGDLAAKRGKSEDVRKFGAMISHDHKTVRQLGRDLAAKLGVTPTAPKPDQGAIDHTAAMKKLGALKGAAFDHAFLLHEVAFHAAINKTLLPAIQNAELKALVVKVAPAFQAHMMAAQALDTKLFPNSKKSGM